MPPIMVKIYKTVKQLAPSDRRFARLRHLKRRTNRLPMRASKGLCGNFV